MENFELFKPKSSTKYDTISKEDLIAKHEILESEYIRALREIYKLKYQHLTNTQLTLVLNEHLAQMRREQYGASSERYKKPVKTPEEKQPPKPRVKLPSERYPNIPVREVIITQTPLPACTVCSDDMKATSMFDVSEQLNVIPKQYEIILQKQVKYSCDCHSCLVTAEAPPRIIPGSSYSDEMILDIALSKYCDLIPMQRYVAMAGRNGLIHLPPHSLIETTHMLADFLRPAYELVKMNLMRSRVLHADETPHKMLEGSSTKHWYLWGFSTKTLCYLECHPTRSGDVACDVLKNNESVCEILISDVFSGYKKAVRVANIERQKNGKNIIKNAYCNAHARRYFFKAYPTHKEAQYFLDQYHEIYKLESISKDHDPPQRHKARNQMRLIFLEMKQRAIEEIEWNLGSLSYGRALRYFLENFDGLTLCLNDVEIALDNNLQEGLLRNHVIGRKTWYGTHSKLGAKTASILFTLVETCKLNHVNPREYFNKLTQALLNGEPPFLPSPQA
jgi:transposase